MRSKTDRQAHHREDEGPLERYLLYDKRLRDNPSARQVVGMKFELNTIARSQADDGRLMLPQRPGNAAMTVSQFDAIGALIENFDYDSPGLKLVCVRHGET